MKVFGFRVSGNGSSRRRKARSASRFPACIAEQLESRSMLSGIGITVMPPVAPVTTGPVSPVMIAPPSATGSGSVVDPPVTLPVIRESMRIVMPAQEIGRAHV